MTALIQALGWALLHFLWEGAFIGAFLALCLWALEGRDARLRYAVACLGLVLMTAAPAATFLLVRERTETTVQMGSSAPPPSVGAVGTAKGDGAVQPVRPVDEVLPWLVALWMAGSLAMSLRLAGGWVWLQWLRRRRDTRPAGDAEQLLLLRLCQRMKVGSNLRLLLCRSVPGPTVLGWLKPVILIPPALVTGLSPGQLELILAHELAHVLRHDFLVNLLQSVAEVLFFFHPAVWWLSKKIRQERELASDDLAVRLRGDALDYAQALTALAALAARARIPQPAPRLALGAQGGDFMSRIQRLLSPTAPTRLAPRAGLVVLLLLGAGLALPAGGKKPAPQGAIQEAPLPKGTVRLRRYDADTPDGWAKAGTIDLRVQSAPYATIERAFATIQGLPANPAAGYEEVVLTATPGETGKGIWTYQFTATDPARVLMIIRAQAAAPDIEKKPGMLVVMRINGFTAQGGLLPRGLYVRVYAGDVPVKEVLKALNELEAMSPQAGIPQFVRREIPPGTVNGKRITLDLAQEDPLKVRDLLEAELSTP